VSNTVVKTKTVQQYKNIPFLFNGGLYGLLCRNRLKRKFNIIYFVSLLILVLNGVLIWVATGGSLGFIGLITNFVYDLFILTFNTLDTP